MGCDRSREIHPVYISQWNQVLLCSNGGVSRDERTSECVTAGNISFG